MTKRKPNVARWPQIHYGQVERIECPCDYDSACCQCGDVTQTRFDLIGNSCVLVRYMRRGELIGKSLVPIGSVYVQWCSVCGHTSDQHVHFIEGNVLTIRHSGAYDVERDVKRNLSEINGL